MAAPTCREGFGSPELSPLALPEVGGSPGGQRAPAGCCSWRMRSVVLPAEAGACVGAEGAGKAAGPFPPPLPSLGWAIPWPVPPLTVVPVGVSGGAWPEGGS